MSVIPSTIFPIQKCRNTSNHLNLAILKELEHLYRFAELGQLTTIILHELANCLSVLTLDIDDLEDDHQNSIAIKHAKESIFYIDTIIEQVRNQVQGNEDMVQFDALKLTEKTIEQLKKKLKDSHITFIARGVNVKEYYILGDPLRLSQVITILVTNAAQATRHNSSQISVEANSTKSKIRIMVKDTGIGITPEARKTLFQPQRNKTGTGLGIGLYVTKQIINTHFKGKIWISPSIEYTQFIIEIPKKSVD